VNHRIGLAAPRGALVERLVGVGERGVSAMIKLTMIFMGASGVV
jgi:hypothetical protein